MWHLYFNLLVVNNWLIVNMNKELFNYFCKEPVAILKVQDINKEA